MAKKISGNGKQTTARCHVGVNRRDQNCSATQYIIFKSQLIHKDIKWCTAQIIVLSYAGTENSNPGEEK
jgi:hypothetical protein